jgi:hypothetical protein
VESQQAQEISALLSGLVFFWEFKLGFELRAYTLSHSTNPFL